MADVGESFRRLGQDISGAITEPAKARLQMAVTGYEMGKEQDMLAKKTSLAGKIGQHYGDEAKAFYQAGDFDSYLKLQQLQVDREKARNAGGDKNRYAQEFKELQMMTVALKQQQDAAQAKADEARKSGDLNAYSEAMQNFNAIHDAANDVKIKLGALTPEGRTSLGNAMLADLDSALASYDPARLEAMQQTVSKQLRLSKTINPYVMDELDSLKDAYGLGINLSGIASDTDLKKYLMAANANGDVTTDEIGLILDSTDMKSLAKITNDDELPKSLRLAAGAKFIRLGTYEGMFKDKPLPKVEQLTEDQQSKLPQAVLDKMSLKEREDYYAGVRSGYDKERKMKQLKSLEEDLKNVKTDYKDGAAWKWKKPQIERKIEKLKEELNGG